jgi:hypothetical protein
MAVFCNFVVLGFKGVHDEICVNLDKIAYFRESDNKANVTSMVLSVRDEDGEPIIFDVVGDLRAVCRRIDPCHLGLR